MCTCGGWQNHHYLGSLSVTDEELANPFPRYKSTGPRKKE
jgi:hypothetical protein